MSDQPVRISLSDLPPRPRAAGDSELEKVFGGCSNNYCRRNEDCCRRICYIFPNSNPAQGSCRPGVG
jgi:hypothetical protein